MQVTAGCAQKAGICEDKADAAVGVAEIGMGRQSGFEVRRDMSRGGKAWALRGWGTHECGGRGDWVEEGALMRELCSLPGGRAIAACWLLECCVRLVFGLETVFLTAARISAGPVHNRP